MEKCSSFFTSSPASPKFLTCTILTDVRWNLRVVLICISLMTKDVEHFLRRFSVIRYSSVENSLFSSVPQFLKIGLFVSLESNFLSSLYILDISPLLDVGLVKIFPNLLVAFLSYCQNNPEIPADTIQNG